MSSLANEKLHTEHLQLADIAVWASIAWTPESRGLMLEVIYPTESDCHIPLLRLCIIEMCRVYGCSILHYTNCLLDIFPRDVVLYFPLGRKTMVKGNGTEEKMTIPHCIVTTPNSELLARNSQMGLEYIATQLQHLTRKTSLQFAIIQGHVNQHRALLK